MSRIRSTLFVYWPVTMMLTTLALAGTIDFTDTTGLTLTFNPQRTLAMLTSPYLLVCGALLVAGLIKAKRVWREHERSFSLVDRMAMVWFLTNACWFHMGCDVFSGLLQVLPTMRDFYISSNAVHLHPMHHPERAFVDAVYYLELFVQVPLCVLTFSLYLKRSSMRPVVEAFLCALHIAGTFAFYLPGLLSGETMHPVLSNLDRAIGSLWLIVPTLLALRAARQVQHAAAMQPTPAVA